MTGYVCKYAPIEVLAGFSADVKMIVPQGKPTGPAGDAGDGLCPYSRAVLAAVMECGCDEVIITDCCEGFKSLADAIEQKTDIVVFRLELPGGEDAAALYAAEVKRFIQAYVVAHNLGFDMEKFVDKLRAAPRKPNYNHIALTGAPVPEWFPGAFSKMSEAPLVNYSFAQQERYFDNVDERGGKAVLDWYAEQLVSQFPGLLPADGESRARIMGDSHILGVIYSDPADCNVYNAEYIDMISEVPLLKLDIAFDQPMSKPAVSKLHGFLKTNGWLMPLPDKTASEAPGQAPPKDAGDIQPDSSEKIPDAPDEASTAPDPVPQPAQAVQVADTPKQAPSAEPVHPPETTVPEASTPEPVPVKPAPAPKKAAAQDVKPAAPAVNVAKPATSKPAAPSKDVQLEGDYFVGIDSGRVATKVLILDESKKVVAQAGITTGNKVRQTALMAMNALLTQKKIARSNIKRIVATGHGRNVISDADKDVSEIDCHAKGALFLFPGASTIIDIGGQDCKVIDVDSGGNVMEFSMNDKCAAGTGMFLDTMAKKLKLDISAFSVHADDYSEDLILSSGCAFFAGAEVDGFLEEGKSAKDIVHAINGSLASRITGMIASYGSMPAFILTGGVAKNKGLVEEISLRVGEPMFVPDDPSMTGALGAALFALEDFSG